MFNKFRNGCKEASKRVVRRPLFAQHFEASLRLEAHHLIFKSMSDKNTLLKPV